MVNNEETITFIGGTIARQRGIGSASNVFVRNGKQEDLRGGQNDEMRKDIYAGLNGVQV